MPNNAFDLGADLYGMPAQQPTMMPVPSTNLGHDLYGAPSPSVSTAQDVVSAGAWSVPKGIGHAVMWLPELANQVVAGPQELYRGIRDTVQGNPTDNSPMFQPFFNSGDVMNMAGVKPYEPQTIAGKLTDFSGQTLAGLGTAGAIASQGTRWDNALNGVKSLLQDQSSGTPPPAPLTARDIVERGINSNTMFASRPNALQTGQQGNEAISKQYGIDRDLQRQLYADLDQHGSKFSIKADELYNKLDDLTNYLSNKVAIDTPEHRAFTELSEMKDNLANKYGIASVAPKTSAVLDASGNPIITPGQQGVAAYGIQPSDLVDLKTAINSGLKPNKFTNAGQAKILDFKSYVQNALDQASQLSPEFGGALSAAEKQAAKVGIYKDPMLRGLWQPEDYVAYKAGNQPSASTFNRQAGFLNSLDTTNAGRSYSLASILPPDQAQSLIRAAALNQKTGGIKSFILPAPDPRLQAVADQIANMRGNQ